MSEKKPSRRARDRALRAEVVAKHARPPTREEKIRSRMASGDWAGALKAAIKLGNLGDDKVAIERAWEACARPAFCRQLGRDPEKLFVAGVEALRRRFP